VAKLMSPEATRFAIQAGLNRILADKLTEEFTAAAKPIIDRAVKEAMASMETGIRQFYQPEFQRELVEVIIKDKRNNDLSERS
jgi:hypothetical protein